MSGDLNTSILNRVRFVLFGYPLKARESDEPKPVALSEDRELMIAARITGGDLQRVPEPTLGSVMTGVSTVYFTATKVTELEIELVNSLNVDGATALVTYRVNPADAEKVAIPSVTPIPLGVGVRIGKFLLNPGGVIIGSCSPPQSVTIHPIPYRIGS